MQVLQRFSSILLADLRQRKIPFTECWDLSMVGFSSVLITYLAPLRHPCQADVLLSKGRIGKVDRVEISHVFPISLVLFRRILVPGSSFRLDWP